ncbi:adenosylcobalamin-dependent ribonucleoside-diphosphate reductase [Thermoplasmatales archaeon SW_10_69_26]|nr:MAG: adenosylcobalamin-dependent ribonucleoside-diphosphate reductase [Thermoplasmatales archaeon SW_10_69_26]
MASVVTEQEESSPDELPQEALDYFDGDELQARCFIEKYALETDEEGLIETHPKQMWERVAEAMASVEEDQSHWFDEFHWLLEDFTFVPGGRILHGAGNPRDVTLTNCYYTGIEEDSLEAIFDWCKSAARTYSYGGGNGVDIGVLRPQGTPVNNAARTSSGAVSFMELFSTTTGTIGQHGRRGALMISSPVWHPDIEDFVSIKSDDLDSVRYANISVKVDDEFMEAVQAGEEYTLHYESEEVGRVEDTVDARELWDEMITSAHASAEPGILFWDNVKAESPSEYCAPVEGTNPCGEQPLESNGACTLGHVNVASFIEGEFQQDADVDWDGIERAVRTGVRFLDDVVEYNLPLHAHEEQAEQARNTRRIGLGVTGLGDMLAKLRIKYDSDDAIAFVDRLMERIRNWAYDESTEIAKEKEPFPLFDAEEHLDRPFVQRLPQEIKDKIAEHGLRNVALLTVAPVGSGSVLTGTTSGVEPIFQLKYQRRSESLSQEFYEVDHRLVQEYRDATGNEEGELPDFFVTAHDIDPFFRVKMQGTLQPYVDSAISSTVNLPADIDVETVKEVYEYAWELGCKGVTVYRESSREGILISEEESEGDEDAEAQAVEAEEAAQAPVTTEGAAEPSAVTDPQTTPRPRPDVTMGTTQKIETGYGSLYVTINEDERGLFEVFAQIGRGGGYTASFTEAVARLISLGLRSGVPVEEIVEQLEGIRSPKIAWDHGEQIYSVPDALATALQRQLSGEFRKSIQARVDTFADGPGTGAHGEATVKTDTEAEKETVDEEDTDQAAELVSRGRSPECPDCSAMLVYEEGCVKCHGCGYSEC